MPKLQTVTDVQIILPNERGSSGLIRTGNIFKLRNGDYLVDRFGQPFKWRFKNRSLPTGVQGFLLSDGTVAVDRAFDIFVWREIARYFATRQNERIVDRFGNPFRWRLG